MPVNLLNEKDLNNYLADIVYHGQEMETFKSGDFKSTAFVEQNKDAIVRSMLLQWCKHRLRSHLAEDLAEHRDFLKPVKADEPDLPAWAERCLKEGKPIHRFDADKIPARLNENIGMIRDYLYSAAESYVNKTLARVKDSNAKGKEEVAPKLRIDYLKTQEAYETFAKTLEEAQKWHDIMAQKAELRKRNEKMYQASLAGTQSVMKLADGMEIVQLTTPEALDYESEYMGHCVGDGGYDSGVKEGSTKIYSLRDADGMPHATFEVRKDKYTGKEEIWQCKGKGNKAPVAKYRPYVQEFVKSKDFEIKGDEKNIGLVKIYDTKTKETEYYDIYGLSNLPKDREYIVKGDLDLSNMNLSELPDLSGLTVEGNFDCSNNQLTSLKGAPQNVGGNFDCGKNRLTTLEGAPQEVGGFFACLDNKLTTLKGAPQKVGSSFYCSNNQLTTLEGAPQEVDGDFYCNGNKLTTLEGVPQEVGGNFNCSDNRLTSLEGAPQNVNGNFSCSGNLLATLKGAPQNVNGDYNCSGNLLTTLKGAPQKVRGNFYCSSNLLNTLEGAPQEVKGSFVCRNNQLTTLGGAPQEVDRNFDCRDNQLATLEGAPQKVYGNFDCSNNQLTSLKGAPQIVGEKFYCNENRLVTLEGAPQEVGSSFYCCYNKLLSLKGAPQLVGGNFACTYNQLITLEGAPQKVFGDFDCSNNQLTTLEGAPQEVRGDFNCEYNQLVSLKGAPQTVKETFCCIGNPLQSLKFLSVCRFVQSDINPMYDPDILQREFDRVNSRYEVISKSPRFRKENQEILNGKSQNLRYIIKRNEAAKNISPEKGKVKPKRKGIDKQKAKINVLLARIKQFFKS